MATRRAASAVSHSAASLIPPATAARHHVRPFIPDALKDLLLIISKSILRQCRNCCLVLLAERGKLVHDRSHKLRGLDAHWALLRHAVVFYQKLC